MKKRSAIILFMNPVFASYLQHGSVAGPQYVVSNSFDGVSQILSKSLGRSVKVKVSFSKV